MTKKIPIFIVLFCWHIFIANLIWLLWVSIKEFPNNPEESNLIIKIWKILFIGDINGVQFSPFITLTTIGVLFVYISKEKQLIDDYIPPKGIFEWLFFIVLSPIITSGIAIISSLLIFLGLGIIVSIVLLLVITPYALGIHVVFNNSTFYFEQPTYLLNHNAIIICYYLLSFIYLLIFYLTFIRYPRKFYEKKNHRFLSKVYLIFLIYLTPSIFAWLYPVMNNKFLGSNMNLNSEIIPYSLTILGYLFIPGLIICIALIISNNIKTMKINLKDDLIDELKSQHDERK